MTKLNAIHRKTGHGKYYFIRETMQIYSDEMKVYLIEQWAKLDKISVGEMRRRLETAK